MAAVRENLARVRERIAEAARRSGRLEGDIRLAAVTKGVTPDRILEAREAGLTVFAENKVQEAAEKIPLVRLRSPQVVAPDPSCEWHFIGHLQSNKVKTALSLFSLIQSVDSVRLAEEIAEGSQADQAALPAATPLSRHAARGSGWPRSGQAAPRDILLEVNISGLSKRFGFDTEEIYGAVDAINAMTGARIAGLMGMAPHPAAPEAKREAFKKLRNIFSVCKGLVKDKSEMRFLSMGMSDDFESAIEEGSNMIRIGRLLFE